MPAPGRRLVRWIGRASSRQSWRDAVWRVGWQVAPHGRRKNRRAGVRHRKGADERGCALCTMTGRCVLRTTACVLEPVRFPGVMPTCPRLTICVDKPAAVSSSCVTPPRTHPRTTMRRVWPMVTSAIILRSNVAWMRKSRSIRACLFETTWVACKRADLQPEREATQMQQVDILDV